MLTIKIIPNETGSPPGKLADAELHFGGAIDAREYVADLMEHVKNPKALEPITALLDAHGALDGLKLLGFAIWERHTGGRNVTFPAHQYSVNGEKRSFALLHQIETGTTTDRVRDLILHAYAQYEEQCGR